MSQIRTRRTRNPAANPKPNYRALAGVDVEGQKPRRTTAQMAAARQAEQGARAEAATAQQAVLQRIAELENEIDAEAKKDLVSKILYRIWIRYSSPHHMTGR